MEMEGEARRGAVEFIILQLQRSLLVVVCFPQMNRMRNMRG